MSQDLGRGSESTQQGVSDSASVQQVGDGGGQRCLTARWLRGGLQVSPDGWDHHSCAVGQHEQELQAAVAMEPSRDRQRLSLKRMPGTDDRHSLRITVKVVVVVVGSVSYLPSTT